MKVSIAAILAATVLTIASAPAAAAQATPAACKLSDITPTASACVGYFEDNLLNMAHVAEQQAALAAIGLNWDGNFNAVAKTNNLDGATTVDWGKMMFGDTWVAVHYGAGAGLGGQVTGFFRFDAGKTGLSSLMLNIPQGSSDAVLYQTGTVPEPATWAMLIAGFGLTGAAMRRRRERLA